VRVGRGSAERTTRSTGTPSRSATSPEFGCAGRQRGSMYDSRTAVSMSPVTLLPLSRSSNKDALIALSSSAVVRISCA